MRREISRSWLSFIAAGAVRSALSIVIVTSAWLRAGRLPEPAKITASMSAARSDLYEVSPIAQRSASTRFDLPQPLGPTTPVKPGSMTKSVGSTKDLKPCRRRRVIFISTHLCWQVRIPLPGQYHGRQCRYPGESREAPHAAGQWPRCAARATGESRFSQGIYAGKDTAIEMRIRILTSESALQQRIDLLGEFLERGLALDLLAVDEERRRRIDLQNVAGIFLVGGDLVEQRLVLQAGLDLLLSETGLLADPRQGLRGVLHHPVVLLAEQHVGDRKVFRRVAIGDAARQHRAGGGFDVERELAEDVTHLAGVDVFRLDLGKHLLIEGRAMRAGHRGVF